MAYVNTRSTAAIGSIRERIAAFFATVQDLRRRSAVYRQTVRELHQLSDRDLSDLGLTRLSIDRIAHEAAFGR
jgi:uncharacterized protein YjiS (DUF1127 family)